MLVFIVNPNSGNEQGFRKWKGIERFLTKMKMEHSVYITNAKNDAKQISESLTREFAGSGESLRLIAVGGDGTVNEILNGFIFADNISLGYIPTGTGNDLARDLKIPRSPIAALKRILRSKTTKMIDYGVVTYGNGQHRRFIVSCGMGLDAAVTKDKEELQAKTSLAGSKFNPFLYIAIGLKRLLSLTTVKASIVVDDMKKFEMNHLVFVSSHIHRSEGGGFRFSPKADNTDGELSICIIHQKAKLKLARILLSARVGNHLKYPGVRNYDCVNLTVNTEVSCPLHADGEYLGNFSEVRMDCVKNKVRFIL